MGIIVHKINSVNVYYFSGTLKPVDNHDAHNAWKREAPAPWLTQ
jgi:hypothetical protein